MTAKGIGRHLPRTSFPEDVALVVHVAPVIAVLVLGHLSIVGVVTSASLVRASDGGDGDRVEKRGGGDHRRRRYRRRRRWYGGGGCGGRGRRGGAGGCNVAGSKKQATWHAACGRSDVAGSHVTQCRIYCLMILPM